MGPPSTNLFTSCCTQCTRRAHAVRKQCRTLPSSCPHPFPLTTGQVQGMQHGVSNNHAPTAPNPAPCVVPVFPSPLRRPPMLQPLQAPPPDPCGPQSLVAALTALKQVLDLRQCGLALEKQEHSALCDHVAALNRRQTEVEFLDVGGALFHTCRSVLQRGDHVLAVLTAGEFPCPYESNGHHFIDRDPIYFALLLGYLRDGTLPQPLPLGAARALHREARYYGLSALCDATDLQPYLVTATDQGEFAIFDPGPGMWRRMQTPGRSANVQRFSAMALCNGCWFALAHNGVRPAHQDHWTSLEVLDVNQWAWAHVEDCPPVEGHLVGFGGRPVVVDRCHREMFEFDEEDGWAQLPSMPHQRYAFSVGVVGDGPGAGAGAACARAGVVAAGFSVVERYVFHERRWDRLPDMTQTRLWPGLCEWQGRLLVVGGCDTGISLRSVEAYDWRTRRWEAWPSLQYARQSPVPLVYGGRLVVAAGYASDGTFVTEVEWYDGDRGCWRLMGPGDQGQGPGPGDVLAIWQDCPDVFAAVLPLSRGQVAARTCTAPV